jgi:hypothetical protein
LKQCTVQIGNLLVRQICRAPQLVYLIKDYINKIINKYILCFKVSKYGRDKLSECGEDATSFFEQHKNRLPIISRLYREI